MRHSRARFRALAGAVLALALLPGCPTAIAVREVGAQSVHEHLTRNVLSRSFYQSLYDSPGLTPPP